jgi:hypothetical protein
VMTLVSGIGLIAEFGIPVALIKCCQSRHIPPPDRSSSIPRAGMMLWTILCRRYRTRQADAVRGQARASHSATSKISVEG